jgi:hypothetical protein
MDNKIKELMKIVFVHNGDVQSRNAATKMNNKITDGVKKLMPSIIKRVVEKNPDLKESFEGQKVISHKVAYINEHEFSMEEIVFCFVANKDINGEYMEKFESIQTRDKVIINVKDHYDKMGLMSKYITGDSEDKTKTVNVQKSGYASENFSHVKLVGEYWCDKLGGNKLTEACTTASNETNVLTMMEKTIAYIAKRKFKTNGFSKKEILFGTLLVVGFLGLAACAFSMGSSQCIEFLKQGAMTAINQLGSLLGSGIEMLMEMSGAWLWWTTKPAVLAVQFISETRLMYTFTNVASVVMGIQLAQEVILNLVNEWRKELKTSNETKSFMQSAMTVLNIGAKTVVFSLPFVLLTFLEFIFFGHTMGGGSVFMANQNAIFLGRLTYALSPKVMKKPLENMVKRIAKTLLLPIAVVNEFLCLLLMIPIFINTFNDKQYAKMVSSTWNPATKTKRWYELSKRVVALELTEIAYDEDEKEKFLRGINSNDRLEEEYQSRIVTPLHIVSAYFNIGLRFIPEK